MCIIIPTHLLSNIHIFRLAKNKSIIGDVDFVKMLGTLTIKARDAGEMGRWSWVFNLLRNSFFPGLIVIYGRLARLLSKSLIISIAYQLYFTIESKFTIAFLRLRGR